MDNRTKVNLQVVEASIHTGQSQQLSESARTRQESERASLLLNREAVISLWELMSAMYGHKWTSQFSDEIDPGNVWAACLRGISSEQIKNGLNQCVKQGLQWPPSAPEFRTLCTGEGEVTWEHRRQSQSVHEALGYEPKGLENITERDRRKAKGKAEVAKLKAQFGW